MKRITIPFTLLAASFAGCGHTATTSSSPTMTSESAYGAMRVTPITPTRKTLVRTTEQPGQIEAFEETPIHSKIAGFVKKVHVDLGDRVTGPKPASGDQPEQPGQILAELDVPELDAELRQKQATIAQAAAEVTQSTAAVKVTRSAQESAVALLDEAQASVERVDAMFERWKSEFERIKELAAKQAVTSKVADETEQQFKAADAARRETAARIKSAQAKLREADAAIEKADADLVAAKSKRKVAEADEQRTRAMLGYATLRAPFDGIVTARRIDTGHLVQASTNSGGQPLFVVVQAESVRILSTFPKPTLVRFNPAARLACACRRTRPKPSTAKSRERRGPCNPPRARCGRRSTSRIPTAACAPART